jgi:hypothetical protein
MIKYECFTYTDEHWNAIREQVLHDRGVDANEIERQGLSLRASIESAASLYRVLQRRQQSKSAARGIEHPA